MSSNCAEHLSQDSNTVFNIMKKSYSWFIGNDLDAPKLYVPPAWALGKIKKESLSKLSFTHYECTTGMIHNNKFCFIPLVGFEESTRTGALIRRFFNYFNYVMACFTGTIRIAIHPEDFNLYLKNDLLKYLSNSRETILLHELS